MLYPQGIYEQLGFLSIQNILSKAIYGPAGRSQLELMDFMTDAEKIGYELHCVEDYIEFNKDTKGFSLNTYLDIDSIIENFHITNYIYLQEECKNLFVVIKLFKLINAKLFQKRSRWSYLKSEVDDFSPCTDLIDIFELYLDEQGIIKENATPELKKIAQAVIEQQRTIDKLFAQVLRKYKMNNWLADAPESMRSGRRVLSVGSENKRKINGIIHDQSDTGKTTYIEPQEIVIHYNEIQHLYHERRKEFQRILADLSNAVRDHSAEIITNYKILGRLDLIQAKAQLAVKIKGVAPKLFAGPHFGYKKAVHPLLWLKNNEEKKETIRFDFELHNGVHAVLISGPNAGGKSICLKAVGILQLMVQYGLLVPMDEDSVMGVFDSMYVDIGDHQSIDDELSTYSSKLVHMREVIEHAGDHSLVLMDEFGSGSDPDLGGAIGEGWLEQLMIKKCWAVLTTHYSNLKMYAHRRKGIINATMLFDLENLMPLYLLHLGKPGSSYTFEIAQNVKLQSSVLNYAKRKIGKKNVRVEDILVDLQSQKAQLEKRNRDIELQQKKLDQLISQYDRLSFDLSVKKKKFLLDKKQWALQADHEKKKLLDKYIKDLASKEKLKPLEKELVEIKEIKKKTEKEIQIIKEDLFEDDLGEDYVFSKGDFVRINGTQSTGEIVRVQKRAAIVLSGALTMTVALADLRPINEPINTSRSTSINIDKVGGKKSFEPTIDIRGYTELEATETLIRFFDEALITSYSSVSILHGKGTGILKRLVSNMAKDIDAVKDIAHPADDHGGEGISVVYFK